MAGMAAPVSVIIPTLNAVSSIGPTMASLMQGIHAGIIREVILSDGGSRDDIHRLADVTGAVLVTASQRGRGWQLREGAATATADWMLFLHADTSLESNWVDAVARQLQDPQTAGYFRLAFDAKGVMPALFAGWANVRSRVFRLPFGDQGLLIHRRLYDAVGGYPALPLLEDMVISRRIGRRLVPLAATATTSAERYRRDGWIRRGSRNLAIQALFLMGRDPRELATRYLG